MLTINMLAGTSHLSLATFCRLSCWRLSSPIKHQLRSLSTSYLVILSLILWPHYSNVSCYRHCKDSPRIPVTEGLQDDKRCCQDVPRQWFLSWSDQGSSHKLWDHVHSGSNYLKFLNTAFFVPFKVLIYLTWNSNSLKNN